jgi:hypothetical protein
MSKRVKNPNANDASSDDDFKKDESVAITKKKKIASKKKKITPKKLEVPKKKEKEEEEEFESILDNDLDTVTDVCTSLTFKIDNTSLSKKQIRTCFNCRKKAEKGKKVDFRDYRNYSYEVWLCDTLKCKKEYTLGGPAPSANLGKIGQCQHCENIMVFEDAEENIPCLVCGMLPRSTYVSTSVRGSGLSKKRKTQSLPSTIINPVKNINM